MFVVAALPVMIVMILLIMDVGQLLVTRVRLQNTADAAALSAAVVQAVGMNEIADLNKAATEEWKPAKNILESGRWYSYWDGKKAARFFRDVFGHINRYRNYANFKAAKAAVRYAKETAKKNFPEAKFAYLAPTNRLISYSIPKEEVTYWYYSWYSRWSYRNCNKWRRPGSARFEGNHNGRYTIWSRRSGIGSEKVPFSEVRWRKKRRETTFAAVKLSYRPNLFLLGNNSTDSFIPNALKNLRIEFGSALEMTVCAAAKPTGGNIWDGRPYYFADFIPISGTRNEKVIEECTQQKGNLALREILH